MHKKSIRSNLRTPNILMLLFTIFELLTIATNVKIIPISTVFISILEFLTLNVILVIIIFKLKYKIIIHTLYIVYYILFGFILLKHGSSFEYFFSFTNLLMGLIIIIFYSKNNFKSYNCIESLLLLLFFVKFLFTPFGDPNLDLKENQLNPNSMGFFLFIIFCFMFSKYLNYGNKKELFISILILLVQILYLSRNSLLFSVLFAFVAFILKKINYRFTYKGLIIAFLLLFQIFFVYFYSNILFNIIGKGNLLIFGKDIFTGREVIWSDAFKQLSNNWLFGIGNTFVSSWLVEGKPNTNLHNSSLAILVNFGIIALLYITLIFSLISKKIKSNYTFIYLCCILGASYFEVYLISTSSVTIILIGFLCVNSILKEKKNVNT